MLSYPSPIRLGSEPAGSWQLLLVGLAVGLTVGTLLQSVRQHRHDAAADTTAGPKGAPSPGPEGQVWMWAVNPSGIFTSSSSSSLELIGYHPTELIGQSVGMVIDPGELTRATAMVNALRTTDSALPELVISGRHRDGSTYWFELLMTTSSDAAGRIVGYQGRSRLISPEAAQVVATQHIRARIESIINDKLLMTAFQPIVDLTTSKVIGAEALSRFVADPATTPDIWFTDAAAVGLGIELELLAVETALIAARDLPTHLYVSLNASPSTCLDDRFSNMIRRSQIELRRIVVELTEHTEVINYEPLNDVLNGLRRGGLRVAIDDAGSGFASGQHILKINPDMIKIDRSLVTAIDNRSGERALAASMVAIAAHIGATVTAEGIETRAELKCVTALGITAGQGYLLGRPSVTPREWDRWKSQVPNRDLAAGRDLDTAVGQPTAQRRPAARGRHDSTEGSPTMVLGLRSVELGGRPPTLARRTEALANPATPQLSFRPDHQDLIGRTSSRDGMPTPDFAVAVLDALPDATAILDSVGRIIAVNRAWRMFAQDNGADPKATGVGVSYLDVCARAARSGNPDAAETLGGLRDVLAGHSVEHEWEYSCSSPAVSRWFISRITAIGDPTGGAVAAHVNISRRKRSEQELVHRASHDPLTGLANRVLFTGALNKALSGRVSRDRRPDVGLLYIDLDNFKPVNDAYGHAAGDELLLVATHRVRSQVRPQDTVARLGGDEFAVCAPRISFQGLVGMASRISSALATPHHLHGQQLHISASVGTHLAAAGDTAADALHRADLAMYAVKSAKDRPPERPR